MRNKLCPDRIVHLKHAITANRTLHKSCRTLRASQRSGGIQCDHPLIALHQIGGRRIVEGHLPRQPQVQNKQTLDKGMSYHTLISSLSPTLSLKNDTSNPPTLILLHTHIHT